MFHGEYQHAIDPKGRLSIPAEFRAIVGVGGVPGADPVLMLVPNPVEACVDAYTLENWKKLEEKIVSMPSYDPKTIMVKKMLFGKARSCTIDRLGRVLVPQEIRSGKGLQRDVTIVGLLEKFQIWSRQEYKQLMDVAFDPKVFSDLGI